MPFTVEQFFQVFADYNRATWPSVILLNIAALGVLAASLSKRVLLHRMAGVVLAGLWVWSGLVYHLLFFRRINAAAAAFGALFLVQAVLLGVASARGQLLRLSRDGAAARAGAVFIVYALVVYPLIGFAFGHVYPAAPMFGAPCPLTIFTLGVFLAGVQPPRWHLVVIPIAWALIATTAAAKFGVVQDFGLPVAAIVLVLFRLGIGRRGAGVSGSYAVR